MLEGASMRTFIVAVGNLNGCHIIATIPMIRTNISPAAGRLYEGSW